MPRKVSSIISRFKCPPYLDTLSVAARMNFRCLFTPDDDRQVYPTESCQLARTGVAKCKGSEEAKERG